MSWSIQQIDKSIKRRNLIEQNKNVTSFGEEQLAVG